MRLLRKNIWKYDYSVYVIGSFILHSFTLYHNILIYLFLVVNDHPSPAPSPSFTLLGRAHCIV